MARQARAHSHAALAPCLAVRGHRPPPRAREDGGSDARPAPRQRRQRGAADLTPFSPRHQPGPRLGADLRPQFPDRGRRRPRAPRSPQWTHLGAATHERLGDSGGESRPCGTAWMSEDFGRRRGSTADRSHATRTFLRMRGAGENEAAARLAAQSGASPAKARESGSSAPWWSGVQILTLERLG